MPYRTVEGTAKPDKDYAPAEGEIIFENEETEKCIVVQIFEEDSYEKDVLFYVEIMEPHQILDKDTDVEKIMEKAPSELTEEEKVALLGRFRDKPRMQISKRTRVLYTFIKYYLGLWKNLNYPTFLYQRIVKFHGPKLRVKLSTKKTRTFQNDSNIDAFNSFSMSVHDHSRRIRKAVIQVERMILSEGVSGTMDPRLKIH